MKQTLPFQLSCALLALLVFVYLPSAAAIAAAGAKLPAPIEARFPPEWMPWLAFLALLPAGVSPARFGVALASVVASLLLAPALAIAIAGQLVDRTGAVAEAAGIGEYGHYVLAFLGPAAVALVVGLAFQWFRRKGREQRPQKR